MVVMVMAAAGSASAEAVSGTIHVTDGSSLTGQVTVEATDPVTLLKPLAAGGVLLEVTVLDGVLTRYHTNATAAGCHEAVPGDVQCLAYLQGEVEREDILLHGATLTAILARPAAAVALFPGAPDAAGTLRLTPRDGATVHGAPAGTVTTRPELREANPDDEVFTFRHELPTPVLNVSARGGALTAEGAFSLYLFDLDLVLDEDDGSRHFSTGYTDADGARGLTERHIEVVYLHVSSGSLTVADAEDIRVLAGDVHATTRGASALYGATGTLDGDKRAWKASDDDVVLRGHVVTDLTVGEVSDEGLVAHGRPTLLATISGDFTPVGFDAADLDGTLAVTAGAATAGAAASLLVLGVAGTVAMRARRRGHGSDDAIEDAVRHLHAGDVARALAAFDAAVERDPKNAVLHLDRAQCLERLGRQGAARRAFETAVRLAPDNGEAHYHLARNLAAVGLAPSAISHLSQAFSLDPAFAETVREDDAFERLGDHPSFTRLLAYYRRDAGA